jgi:hypothetical protein
MIWPTWREPNTPMEKLLPGEICLTKAPEGQGGSSWVIFREDQGEPVGPILLAAPEEFPGIPWLFNEEQIRRAWREASIYDSCHETMWGPSMFEDFLQALKTPQFPDGKLPIASALDPEAASI